LTHKFLEAQHVVVHEGSGDTGLKVSKLVQRELLRRPGSTVFLQYLPLRVCALSMKGCGEFPRLVEENYRKQQASFR
jgi:hypothetical protein